MDDLALAFLERWTDENVVAVTTSDQRAEAESLAASCIEDAAEEGISLEELEEVTEELAEGQDLVAYFERALEKARLEELDEAMTEDD
jgi:hypothetical protein